MWAQPGCPKTKLTDTQVIQRLRQLNPNIEFKGKYQRRKLPMQLHCRKCDASWSRSWNYIIETNGSCPSCTPVVCHSEAEVRKVIEELTGWKFPKFRPAFLRGLNGGSLELDGYNEEHKVAFEYQGLQHYQLCYYNRFDPQKLKEQKRRDWRKKYQCWYHGVHLIRIPYWVEDAKTFVVSRLQALDIKFVE
jgi:hypothetical protein